MVVRTTPAEGDIVIRAEKLARKRVFVLHVVPGPGQIVFRSRENAVAHVLRFAVRYDVRTWLTDKHGAFLPLDPYVVTTARRSEAAVGSPTAAAEQWTLARRSARQEHQ